MKKCWFRTLLMVLVAVMTLMCMAMAEETLTFAEDGETALGNDAGEITLDFTGEKVAAAEPDELNLLDAMEQSQEVEPEPEPGVSRNDGDIEIDEGNFPDDTFREFVSENFDADGDGWLSENEMDEVTYIDVSDRGIESLEGIEYFSNLVTLTCQGNRLVELNVSKNRKLLNLDCSYNKLTKLDVTQNTSMQTLYFYDNKLTKLDLSKNKNLMALGCSGNKLAKLDVGKNVALEDLGCDQNQLTALNLSKNTKLMYLHCHDNKLTELDLSKNTKLNELNAEGNRIKSIDLKNCPKLQARLKLERLIEDGTVAWVEEENDDYYWKLSIDVTTKLISGNNPLFWSVELNNTNFPAKVFRTYVQENIDKDSNGWLTNDELTAVTEITLRSMDDYADNKNRKNCPSMKGIEHFPNLKSLCIPGCGVKSLNLSKNTALTNLDCPGDKLTKLNVSKNNLLKSLNCCDNDLTDLDVTRNKKLLSLSCGGNKLSKLNVSKNTALQYLDCGNNKLTTLNLSQNNKLKELYCWTNRLKKLDVSKNTALQSLYCSGNKLTALSLGKNEKLNVLFAENNNLKSIDLKNCPKLRARLKLKKIVRGGTVAWVKKEGGEYVRYLLIDAKTKLTSGKKVLYGGK